VPVALNCWSSPTGITGLTGVINIEDSVAELTVRVVLPEIPPNTIVAIMVEVPAFRVVAKPLLESTATFEISDEPHLTFLVIS